MGDSFLAYVEQVLVPTLRKRDIVFMDNVRTHKVAGVREAIEAAHSGDPDQPFQAIPITHSNRSRSVWWREGAVGCIS